MAASLYLHVPFCMSRCGYCAFYSGEPLGALEGYPTLLRRELGLVSPALEPLSTVYFGGGTPSLLGPRAVAEILRALEEGPGLAPGAEITLEVNPGAGADLRGFGIAGVNRLSVGVQSLDDPVLAGLGRAHRARDALGALRAAGRAGFGRISADLMFGLPNLDPPALASSALAVVAAGASHVSAYSIEVHPGTPFALATERGAGHLAASELEAAQAQALAAALEAEGLRPYEVSNFAAPGEECRHNLACWSGRSYRGLGPGAHSYEATAGPWGTRSWNDPGLTGYAAGLCAGLVPPGGHEVLTASESFLEGLFLALRRPVPFALEAHCRRHGVPGKPAAARARQAAAEGLLRPEGPCWVPTPAGLRRADGLAVWLSEAAGPEAPGR